MTTDEIEKLYATSSLDSKDTITVSFNDLETLIWATAILKTIEGAMAQRQRDPFVRPHLQFTAAHDRLAAELRNAKRAAAGTAVPWDGDLTAREQVFLSHLVDQELHGNNYKITPQTRMNPPSEIDSLVAKGMIAIGTIAEGVLWTGEANIKWTPRTDVFDVRSTERGRNKLLGTQGKNG